MAAGSDRLARGQRATSLIILNQFEGQKGFSVWQILGHEESLIF